MTSTTLILLFLLAQTKIISSSSFSDVSSLYDKLLQGYNKKLRPGDNQSIPTSVNVSFNLVSIQEFDEVNGKFAEIGFFEIEWYDTRMSWNPIDYNHTYSMIFYQDDVWTPTLSIINPFSKVQQIGKDFMTVRYLYNGYAYWSPGEILISSCSVDVTYFPFDEQTCRITLTSWGFLPTEILLSSPVSSLKVELYSEHGSWKLSSTSSYSGKTSFMSYISLLTSMKRRPAFYVVNIVLPVMFLMALNSCVFILPAESGERVSYAITVLLAIAVFMTLTGDNLPKTSEPMSLLSYFLTFDLVFSSIICIITIAGLRLHFKDPNHPVPNFLKRLAFCCRRLHKNKSKNDIQPFAMDDQIYDKQNYCTKDSKSIQVDEDVTWKEVSKGLDTMLLWISFFGLAFSILLFFVILTKSA